MAKRSGIAHMQRQQLSEQQQQNKKPTMTRPPVSKSRYVHVLRGTLSYNSELRRHIIRGIWNYPDAVPFVLPKQRFELLRTLDREEDPRHFPADGEFHGSFGLSYYHTTSKGKQKIRKKLILEQDVKIAFIKMVDEEKHTYYEVNGTGKNRFGIFHLIGTATPNNQQQQQHQQAGCDDPTYNIVLQKWYEPGVASDRGGCPGGKQRKRAVDDGVVRICNNTTQEDDHPQLSNTETLPPPPPPPFQHYPKRVVCFRGKLSVDEGPEQAIPVGNRANIGVVHYIKGVWSSGLDHIMADPQTKKGLCNKFEFHCKSSTAISANQFPVSGEYRGWFHLTTAGGKQTVIQDQQINLRFTKNSEGFHNVEGCGFDAFGNNQCTITGTLSADNTITLFRRFINNNNKPSSNSQKIIGFNTTATDKERGAAKGGGVVPSSVSPDEGYCRS